ncbi:MAG: hypothetical protein C0480_01475 [Bradyrhizobium sp.]|jgi:hypothetical protein|uniref:putative phage tail protein n=1 Tax=Bradyrhizobium sp. AZCC 1610 TaxID=3117020 RepID=UPI001DFFFB63|nr:hypothetical protein [Bradyrhizobium sp.]
MITIQNLEVRFEVEGEGDEAVFARMFQKNMRRWQEIAKQLEQHAKKLDDERAIVPNLYGNKS